MNKTIFGSVAIALSGVMGFARAFAFPDEKVAYADEEKDIALAVGYVIHG